ncbi:hypothetical protein HO133_000673 [Letharia lupina]|uniref:Uncharacterized protein n=1 Tax=Letharia lupina TaxID=560253 RepID=A0A8H6CG57_9LECA|nr:uncharacterized protein HO133_000673 [Letharia lupina]KAF6222626.1 hypothetical protein HO133_000673 [Letharia lupina]
MPLYRIKGKITKGSRLAKRERSAKHKHDQVANRGEHHRKMYNSKGNRPADFARSLGTHLRDRRLQLHNYNMRQNRRWLTAKIHTEDDDDIPEHARWPLLQHWTKTEHHQQNPKISDGLALTDDVKSALALLTDERAVAAAQQGNPERVADWWVQPEIKSKRKDSKKKKKGKNAKEQGATAGQGVSVEGFQDDFGALALGKDGDIEEKMKREEGGVSLEEEFEGFESPVMMSPAGSVIGEGQEEEED